MTTNGDPATLNVALQVVVELQSLLTESVKGKLIGSPQSKFRAGRSAKLETVLHPPTTEKSAAQVVYAARTSASVAQAKRFTSAGQLILKGVLAETLKLDIQVTGIALQSSVAESIKDKLTASPHPNIGKAGISSILETELHPSVTVNPATHAV